MKKVFPIIDWLQNYRKDWLKNDLSAGITVGVLLIPQGMAYSLIAGLPPEYGLYASLIPLLIYAVMGSSPHLAVGPVALVALLVASTVAPLADTPEEYLALSILLSLLVGAFQFLFGLFRMGFLVNLLSHPVLSGFVSAAAIVIGLSQLHHLLGIDSVSGNLHNIIYGVGQQITSVHLPTLLIGLAGIVLIFFIRKKFPRIPASLVAVVLGIPIIAFSGLDGAGVSIVGTIPSGLPGFSVPIINENDILALLPMAAAISLVGFMESIAVAKAIQRKSGNYQIRSNQELLALGSANLAGALFQAFPVAGGFSRTAVNYEAGAKTPVASIIGASVIGLTLLILTPLFYYLPHAILGAIIIVAVYGLIEVRAFKKLWKLRHHDRYMFLATFAGTLFLGIEEGILLGVILSMLMLLYRRSRPHYTLMGRIPGTSIFRNVNRYNTESIEGTLIFRFDAPIHFPTAEFFVAKVEEILKEEQDIHTIVLDFNGVNDIDSTGLDELFELIHDLKSRKIAVRLAQVKGPVRDLIKQAKGKTNDIHFYMTIHDAINETKPNLDK